MTWTSFPFQLKAEFACVLGKENPSKELTENFKKNWVDKIIKFAKSQLVGKDVVIAMEDAILQSPSHIKKKLI